MIASELGSRTLCEQVCIENGLLHPVAYLSTSTMCLLAACRWEDHLTHMHRRVKMEL